MPLTDASVENAKPEEKIRKLYDGGGLFLLIHPSGGKWWRFRYRFKGKEKLVSLGTYPKIALTQARTMRDNARQILKQGIDPSALRQAKKAEQKTQKAALGETASATIPSIRCMMDGAIEIWKDRNVMRLSLEEARFVANKLSALVRSCHGIE
jgi:hypothetical protein